MLREINFNNKVIDVTSRGKGSNFWECNINLTSLIGIESLSREFLIEGCTTKRSLQLLRMLRESVNVLKRVEIKVIVICTRAFKCFRTEINYLFRSLPSKHIKGSKSLNRCHLNSLISTTIKIIKLQLQSLQHWNFLELLCERNLWHQKAENISKYFVMNPPGKFIHPNPKMFPNF